MNTKIRILRFTTSIVLLTQVCSYSQLALSAESEPVEPTTGKKVQTPILRDLYQAYLKLDPGRAMKYVPRLILTSSKNTLSQPQKRLQLNREFLLAGYAFSLDDNSQATLNLYTTAYLFAPEDPLTTCLLAESLRTNCLYAKEEQILKVLKSLQNKPSFVYATLASDALRKNSLAEAENFAREGLKVKTSDDSASLDILLARIMVRQGIGRPSGEQFRKAALATENDYLKALLLADAAFMQEDLETNLKQLRKAGTILPADPAWHNKMANYQFGQNDSQAGFDELITAVNCKRSSAESYTNLANYLKSEGKIDQARKTVKRLELLNSNSPFVPALEGDIYRTEGRFKEAISCYEETLRRNPMHVRSYADIANIYVQSGKKDAALKKMKNCVDLMPDYWRSQFMYSSILDRCGKTSEAIESASKGLALLVVPENDLNQLARYYAARSHALLGTSFYRENNREKAISEAVAFNRLKFQPIIPDSLKFVSLRPGRLTFSDDLSDRDPQIRAALADMLLETNQFDNSIKEYREAINLSPNDKALHSYLLHTLAQKGDWVEAAKQNFVLSNKILKEAPGAVARWMKQEKSED
ncbi:MAG: tetratricopeptide repeat protein [Candidatus Obscuribacterales bacterium]|nr:tetratricopeptide repeat protein [Candidatus Obscuribacterales bacterium]